MSPLCILASSSVPPGVRGALTQWMLEVLPGIFVGRPSARVRDRVWEMLVDGLAAEPAAYAALITQTDNEQGFVIRRVGTHRYTVEEFAGLQLVTVRHTPRADEEPEEPLGIDQF